MKFKIYFPVFVSAQLIQIFIVLLQWLEAEIVRLSHLRDRASENGRRKEYPFSFKKFKYIRSIMDPTFS
jgi:hypothetical protein